MKQVILRAHFASRRLGGQAAGKSGESPGIRRVAAISGSPARRRSRVFPMNNLAIGGRGVHIRAANQCLWAV
jgi:hypothetical protein